MESGFASYYRTITYTLLAASFLFITISLIYAIVEVVYIKNTPEQIYYNVADSDKNWKMIQSGLGLTIGGWILLIISFFTYYKVKDIRKQREIRISTTTTTRTPYNSPSRTNVLSTESLKEASSAVRWVSGYAFLVTLSFFAIVAGSVLLIYTGTQINSSNFPYIYIFGTSAGSFGVIGAFLLLIVWIMVVRTAVLIKWLSSTSLA